MRALLIALLMLLMAFSVAAQDESPVVEPLDPPETIRVAYVPILKFAPLYVAAERGLFEKYGLEAEIESVSSGTEAIAFLAEGQIDVGGIAIVTSLWNGWDQGLDIRIIAPGGLEPMENSPTQLIVRSELIEDGEVETLEDLEGLTIGIAGGPGSGGEYLLAKALEPSGLTIFDVEMVNISNADMPLAFENGALDAAIVGAPFADQIIAAGDAMTFATDFTPGLMTVAFVGSSQFITERPEVALRFVLALTEASRLMYEEGYYDQENIDAYLTYTNTTEEAILSAVPFVYDPNMVIPLEGLQDVESTHRENGRTEYEEPIDLENVVELSFVEQALELLGEYEMPDMMEATEEPETESSDG